MARAPIDPVGLRLAQLLGEEAPASSRAVGIGTPQTQVSPFQDVLSKAVDALEGVSKQEIKTNQLIEGYLKGNVDLSKVMIESSKLSIMVQMAVTTVNTAVSTFKEITQMQV